jgi:hypothetical protein
MTDKRSYYSPGYEYPLDSEALSDVDRDTQMEVMRDWFFENYEVPAESTPHEEGEYIYIWGGPYDARDELEAEFGDIVAEDAIVELANELEDISGEWASKHFDEVRDIATINSFFQNFHASLENVRSLLEAKLNAEAESHLFRLLYANVITALEVYLSDAFINTTLGAKSLLRRFVETTPAFKEQRFSISELYQTMDNVEKKARKYLGEVIWHHLERVKPMYKETLGIEFPLAEKIFKAIAIRHDIVHRNGKTKDGKEHIIQQEEVRELLSEVEGFVEHIATELAKLKI